MQQTRQSLNAMTSISCVIANSKLSRSQSLHLPPAYHVPVGKDLIRHLRRGSNGHHLGEVDCFRQIEVFWLIFRIIGIIRLKKTGHEHY